MKKIYCLLLCFIVFWAAIGGSESANAAGDDIDVCFTAFLAENDCSSMQEYLSGARSGTGLDAAFCMRRYVGGLDFSVVSDAIDLKKAGSASTREKYLFYQKAFGKEVSGSSEDVYALGIMSRVFALHLLKNNIPIEGVNKGELVAEILSMRKEDGGWALFGSSSDVDVTSMCMQALAGECDSEVVESAISFLSSAQQQDGTFKTMGANNCESTAQVIITLSALGIDCAADERFIKSRSALDALMSYRMDNNLFCHEQGGVYNERATVQALSALVAYKLYKEKGEAFYSLPEYGFGKAAEVIGESKSKAQIKANLPVNAWVAVGIAGACVLACVVLVLTKKGGWKEITVILVVGCGVSLFIGLSTFQSVDEYYSESLEEGDVIVYVSIRKDVIDSNDPVIFSGNVGVKENGTVLDAIVIATRKGKLQLSYVTGYIQSIDNLAEFSYGNESGWMFAVNGEFSDVNCSEKKVKTGDKICFLYTTKMGSDVSDFFEVNDEY